jgi:hypothetical protein
MSDWMRQVLESKRAMRQRLGSLPIAEKLALLEKLRARTLVIRAARPAKPAFKNP